MRRSILSRKSEDESEIEKGMVYAERMEQKWLDRVKDEGVSYAWLWVA